MAQDERGAGGNLPVAGLLALILFASGLLVQHQPLQSDRPVAEIRTRNSAGDGQGVEARLWQDPFDAVQRSEQTIKPDGTDDQACQHAPPYVFDQIERGFWLPGESLVLPVMVFGGPYAEDVEERRRSRYAVLSALRAANYEPVNPRGIGYVKFDDYRELPRGLVVPFERWREIPVDAKTDCAACTKQGSPVPAREVLVVWIKEEAFSSQTRVRFNALFAALFPPSVTPRITILGPSSPQTVRGLFDGDGKPISSCTRASPELAEVNGICRKFISPILTEPGSDLGTLRMSPRDDELAEALIAEFVNRGISLPPKDRPDADQTCLDHVALVVESDTHYGRSLERVFRSRLAACAKSGTNLVNHLHVFRYFRGLDGRVAQVPDAARKSGDGSKDGQKKEATAPQEQAQGQGQFDYLLRIAADVRRQNEDLSNRNWHPSSDPTGRSIRAVVVLGSDIHDKLAIFHALRERLPQALFATTDLDAGLLQSDQLAWTRNLIVSSGYDLSLPDELQGGAAPFRDTYQTASFLATRLALANEADQRDKALVSAIRNIVGKPKLFEVGNGEAVELVQAGAPAVEKTRHWGPVILGLVLLGVFGYVYSWCLRDLLKHRWRYLLLAALAILAYVVGMLSIAGMPGEEPFYLVKGVSAWPAELIRLCTLCTAIGMAAHCWIRLRDGDAAIARDFFDDKGEDKKGEDEKGEGDAGDTSYRARLSRGARQAGLYLRGGWISLIPGRDDDASSKEMVPIDVAVLWQQYRGWTSLPCSAIRVAVGLVAYFMFCYLVISVDLPLAPVRGAASLLADKVTTIAAVICMLLLLLVAVLDRVAMASLFLRRLYGDHSRARTSAWRDEVLKDVCGFVPPLTDHGARANAVRGYVDLRLSAQLTGVVGKIVFYPFVLSLMMILARSRYFDNWVMPRGLMLVVVLGLCLVVVGAFALRSAAEQIRASTIESLTEAEIALRAAPAPAPAPALPAGGQAGGPAGEQAEGGRPTPEQLKLMRETAIHLKQGAFAPISEQPVIRALILPFGGAGLMSLLDWAMFMKW